MYLQFSSFMNRRKILSNIVSLSLLQVASFALTLAILPYLTRVLGVESWGNVTFVTLIINYILWLVNWSFYLSATKEISSFRNNKKKVSLILTNILAVQWFFSVIFIFLLFIVVKIFTLESNNESLYLAASGLIIGNALTPLWFLNGLEHIKESALIQLMTKIIAVPFIFLFVTEKSDVVLFLSINSASSIIVGIFVIYMVCKKNYINISYISKKNMYHEIVKGYELFFGAFWANVRTQLIPTVLGLIAGPVALGYFSIAERAKSAAIVILHPISQALFPRMCYLFNNNVEDAKSLLKSSGYILIALSAIMSASLFIFSENIINILGGKEFYDAKLILEIMSPMPFLSTISTFIIHQIIIPMGKSKIYNKVMFIALLINATLAYPLISMWEEKGATIVLLLSEIFIVVYTIFFLSKKNMTKEFRIDYNNKIL